MFKTILEKNQRAIGPVYHITEYLLINIKESKSEVVLYSDK